VKEKIIYLLHHILHPTSKRIEQIKQATGWKIKFIEKTIEEISELLGWNEDVY
jgi:hypothetical protein